MRFKEKYLVIVLIILLILSLGYIVIDKVGEVMQQKRNTLMQSAMGLGYKSAVIKLINEAGSCNPVPVTAGNVTLHLIAMECLTPVK